MDVTSPLQVVTEIPQALGPAASPSFGALTVSGAVSVSGNNSKLNLPTGSTGPCAGIATLVAGTVTVSTTAVSASSQILATAHTVGGTQGILSVPTRTAGTSFVITSSSATDTSTVDWALVN